MLRVIGAFDWQFHVNSRLLCVLFLGAFLGSFLSPAVSAQEIPNASFEQAASGDSVLPQDWGGPAPNFARDDSTAHSGTASFRWTNADPALYRLSHADVKGLEPGKRYTLSGWVKTENVRGGKAAICLEWNGPDGKYLGGIYAHGVAGTKDWQQISTTFTFPENAQKPYVDCYGTRGAVGTAWFDDLEIQPYIPPCFTGSTTDHYRNQTIGGSVRVFAGLSFPEASFSDALKGLIELEVTDQTSGQTVQTLRNFTWGPDCVVFTVDSDKLPVGTYTLTVKVPNPQKETHPMETTALKLTRLEKFPDRKAYIDEHKRLIVDGKPFFPLGLYFHSPSEEDIERLEKSPFNCIMSYSRMSRETLDALHRHGIASIYSVKDLYEGLHCSNDAEGREQTTRLVNDLKDHPAIIGWYINDELPLSMKKELTGHRDLVEELDPSRPTWVVLYQIDDIREYLPTFDVIGTDPYPIPEKPASMAYQWSKKTQDACFGVRASWQVPQYFCWSSYGQNTNRRGPTFDEMRAMTWMNIAGGANGIVGYSYYDLLRFDGKDKTEAEKKATFERLWKWVCQIAAEVKKHEAVLLSIEKPAWEPEPLAPIPEKDGVPCVATRLYAYQGDCWLIVVNTQKDAQSVQFQLPAGVRAKNADEWPGVECTQDGTTLTIQLNALTPAFLQMGK